jgi:hypothetical protein
MEVTIAKASEMRKPIPGRASPGDLAASIICMIRKLKSGEYRLYSRKKNPTTGKRRNLGTFSSMEKAKQHERAVQFFKRH